MRSFQACSGLWPLCARVAYAGPGGGGAVVSVCRRFRLSSFPSVVVSVCRRFRLSSFPSVVVSVCRRFRLPSFPSVVERPTTIGRSGLASGGAVWHRAERSGIGRSGLASGGAVWFGGNRRLLWAAASAACAWALRGWGCGCAACDAWMVRAEVAGGGRGRRLRGRCGGGVVGRFAKIGFMNKR